MSSLSSSRFRAAQSRENSNSHHNVSQRRVDYPAPKQLFWGSVGIRRTSTSLASLWPGSRIYASAMAERRAILFIRIRGSLATRARARDQPSKLVCKTLGRNQPYLAARSRFTRNYPRDLARTFLSAALPPEAANPRGSVGSEQPHAEWPIVVRVDGAKYDRSISIYDRSISTPLRHACASRCPSGTSKLADRTMRAVMRSDAPRNSAATSRHLRNAVVGEAQIGWQPSQGGPFPA